MNANDAVLTEMATAQSGSKVADDPPNAPGRGGFGVVVAAVVGSVLGSSSAPHPLTTSAIDLTTVDQPWPTQALCQAFDAASGWRLSGPGPDYECIQTFSVTVPGGGPCGPLAGHTLQYVASHQPGRPDRVDHPKRPVQVEFALTAAAVNASRLAWAPARRLRPTRYRGACVSSHRRPYSS